MLFGEELEMLKGASFIDDWFAEGEARGRAVEAPEVLILDGYTSGARSRVA